MDIDKFVAKPGCPRKQRFCAKCQKPMLISTAKFCSKGCRDTSKQFARQHVYVTIAKKRYLLDDLVRQSGVARRTLINRIQAGTATSVEELTRPPLYVRGTSRLLGFENRDVQSLRDAWL